ncbi:MAG: spermidine synthase [Rhodobacterales bacterium CG_4_9_14_3_um_filter_71_31]|nr:MAG: spermidine synthase [Rhodobacterales bacterium CG_4_9_14_3_um_filter_71_31]
MTPWVHLDTAQVPGGGTLKLARRGDEFSIRLDGAELMNSRLSGSEAALATLAFARLGAAARVLIGGLGMGFTLRAALAVAGADARLEVVEIAPAVIAWARGPMAALHGDSLDDPRVTLAQADVAATIGAAAGAAAARYDAILLDVDNGPEAMSRPANDALYADDGLRAARRALRPGGVLAVWSVARDPAFTRRLRRAGFAVEENTVRASTSGRGARHTIWIAVRT